MKSINKGPHKRSLTRLISKSLVSVLLLTGAGILSPLQAQEDQYTKPSWYFGAAAGANLNFYRGTTQELNPDLTVPAAFHHGQGTGLYLAPLVEYHKPDSHWGGMFQLGYDSRKGKFKEVLTPCNCPADLSTGLSYLTVEPSLRLTPFKSNFYVYGGPRLAFNLSKSFTYELKTNPAYPAQVAEPKVKDFKEDQLEVFAPKKLSGRSEREMIVYYNILNILGDRMGKNPTATITLVGSSEKGPETGTAMAASVKRYLVDIFGIDASRISIQGQSKLKIPSVQPGGTQELELLHDGERRVSIESASPALLMEFQSGPEASLKPVVIVAVQKAPLDSYVAFDVKGGKEAFVSWSLEIRNKKGEVQYFGPYTQEKISIPGKSILGTRPEGDYKVMLIGQTKNGKKVQKETTVHMVLWTPPKDEEGMRFSVLFEFNESKTIAIYQKYLTDILTPKIPVNGKVIIHGHTDIIGDENYNLNLSQERANEVKKIIEEALAKSARTDVKFEVYGFGEDDNMSPFENKYPEERFYNRTVIIDIIAGK
jgi:outer membrane protein OmpA-like peptidoglycan-associated protein